MQNEKSIRQGVTLNIKEVNILPGGKNQVCDKIMLTLFTPAAFNQFSIERNGGIFKKVVDKNKELPEEERKSNKELIDELSYLGDEITEDSEGNLSLMVKKIPNQTIIIETPKGKAQEYCQKWLMLTPDQYTVTDMYKKHDLGGDWNLGGEEDPEVINSIKED